MTNEGIFPKVSGDVLYASEVNSFRTKLIGQVVQNLSLNISGTNFGVIGGSLLYTGNGTEYIRANSFASKNTTGTDQFAFRVRISGTAGLNITNTAIDKPYSWSSVLIDHIFTSGAITASGGNIGSNYVLFLKAQSILDAGNIAQVHNFTGVAV